MEDDEPPSTSSTSSESPEVILKAPTSTARRRKTTRRGEIVCFDTKRKRVLILAIEKPNSPCFFSSKTSGWHLGVRVHEYTKTQKETEKCKRTV
ncbi:hypothetical protein GCK72_005668 [Caenorhabditis remanei]|uniref:Uncharacterized protein n=1 Tax=Caenorhabditis remanei TaxID=31234 RepID=A0A6A5HED1_CAERE|nr:hypothetical protein GCK72_005668 [Caenorhabditis remanei]KAF1765715.1 hypothetical protein GCK72_005668 [Caenorhabditis remanei]